MLKPTNCGNLLGSKCGVGCLNGYEEEQPSPSRECKKSEDDLAYWTGEETNCTGKHLAPVVQRLDNAIHRIIRNPVDKC